MSDDSAAVLSAQLAAIAKEQRESERRAFEARQEDRETWRRIEHQVRTTNGRVTALELLAAERKGKEAASEQRRVRAEDRRKFSLTSVIAVCALLVGIVGYVIPQ